MHIAAIVAASLNRVIGKDNQLPWHIPEDLKYFRSVTLGKPIIMGRNTFDSIGRPLPGRTNIVVTTNTDWQHEGVLVAHDLSGAIALGKEAAVAVGASEVMLIGGARLYEQCLAFCDRLYYTEVAVEIEGDAFFPALEPSAWQEVACESLEATAERPACHFRVLERRAA